MNETPDQVDTSSILHPAKVYQTILDKTLSRRNETTQPTAPRSVHARLQKLLLDATTDANLARITNESTIFDKDTPFPSSIKLAKATSIGHRRSSPIKLTYRRSPLSPITKISSRVDGIGLRAITWPKKQNGAASSTTSEPLNKDNYSDLLSKTEPNQSLEDRAELLSFIIKQIKDDKVEIAKAIENNRKYKKDIEDTEKELIDLKDSELEYGDEDESLLERALQLYKVLLSKLPLYIEQRFDISTRRMVSNSISIEAMIETLDETLSALERKLSILEIEADAESQALDFIKTNAAAKQAISMRDYDDLRKIIGDFMLTGEEQEEERGAVESVISRIVFYFSHDRQPAPRVEIISSSTEGSPSGTRKEQDMWLTPKYAKLRGARLELGHKAAKILKNIQDSYTYASSYTDKEGHEHWNTTLLALPILTSECDKFKKTTALLHNLAYNDPSKRDRAKTERLIMVIRRFYKPKYCDINPEQIIQEENFPKLQTGGVDLTSFVNSILTKNRTAITEAIAFIEKELIPFVRELQNYSDKEMLIAQTNNNPENAQGTVAHRISGAELFDELMDEGRSNGKENNSSAVSLFDSLFANDDTNEPKLQSKPQKNKQKTAHNKSRRGKVAQKPKKEGVGQSMREQLAGLKINKQT